MEDTRKPSWAELNNEASKSQHMDIFCVLHLTNKEQLQMVSSQHKETITSY